MTWFGSADRRRLMWTYHTAHLHGHDMFLIDMGKLKAALLRLTAMRVNIAASERRNPCFFRFSGDIQKRLNQVNEQVLEGKTAQLIHGRILAHSFLAFTKQICQK